MADLDQFYGVNYAVVSVANSTPVAVAAAVSGQKYVVVGYLISAATAVVFKWQSKPAGTAVELTGLGIALPANGTVASGYNPNGWFTTASGSALQITLSGTSNVGGHVAYLIVKDAP